MSSLNAKNVIGAARAKVAGVAGKVAGVLPGRRGRAAGNGAGGGGGKDNRGAGGAGRTPEPRRKPDPNAVRPDEVVRWGPVWGRRVGQLLDHVVWDTEVIGAGNVPANGPVILAANHTGVIDGPVLHGASPRGSHIIVKAEMFKGVLGAILRYSGQIPVNRRSGRAALAAALALLAEGRVVGIFPEGTRGSGSVASAQAGIAFLAVHSGAPVVPVAILGTRPSGRHVGHVPSVRTRLAVDFGTPIEPVWKDKGSGREALQAAMEAIQAALATHVDAASVRTGIGFPEEAPDKGEEVDAAQAAAAELGVPVEGHEITVSRRLAAPPEAVWEVLTDLPGAEQVLSGVTKIEMLSEGPYAVGTRWRETRTMWGKEATEEMWVTAVEPQRRTVVEANPGQTHYRTQFTLRPVGDGSQLEVRFSGWTANPSLVQKATWKVLGPIGARASAKMLEKDLEEIGRAAAQRAGLS